MIAALDTALAHAEALIGGPLEDDCVDPATGEPEPLIIVTDNGPAMRSVAVAAWFQKRPWLTHVRTRHKAPQTNGVIERWFESLKYERLYRHDIDGADDLARPHRSLHRRIQPDPTPREHRLATTPRSIPDHPRTLKPDHPRN